MSIKESEKQIFDEIREKDSSIVDDGIVDEESYKSSKYKIVYIMKEVNGGEDWSLKEFLYKGGRAFTWGNIARWTEGILNLDQDFKWDYLEANNEDRRNTYLKKIGVVNLKKTSGKHTADNKVIYNSAIENSEIIKKQIDLYKPDIIICCGTKEAFVKSYYVSERIDWKMTDRGVCYFSDENKTIISFAHPEARIRSAYLYYTLIDAIREILI